MKTKILLFIMLIIGLTCSSLKAQTGSDYYLPLCTGNFVKLYTDGTPGAWAARNTYYTIVRSDTINGRLYHVEKGMEILDISPTDTSVFHYFWLRKDSIGNILAGAYDPGKTGVIDSAIIINPPFLWFPNEYLTLGYSRSVSAAGITTTDSVINISATAGTYTNCIQIRSTRKNGGTLERIVDAYYAFHLGQVKGEILYPNNDAHADNIVEYIAANCYLGVNDKDFGNENGFGFYPNPTSTNITIETQAKGSLAILNLNGQLLLQQEITEPTTTFDLSTLPSGIYVLKVIGEKGVQVGKFIKE